MYLDFKEGKIHGEWMLEIPINGLELCEKLPGEMISYKTWHHIHHGYERMWMLIVQNQLKRIKRRTPPADESEKGITNKAKLIIDIFTSKKLVACVVIWIIYRITYIQSPHAIILIHVRNVSLISTLRLDCWISDHPTS